MILFEVSYTYTKRYMNIWCCGVLSRFLLELHEDPSKLFVKGREFLPGSEFLTPALNARAAQALYIAACPIATQFPGHGCTGDHTTGGIFD